MLSQLQILIETTHPKQIGKTIKNDKNLLDWVLLSTANLSGDPTISERVYAILNNIDTNVCLYSNKIKKFKSIKDGYGFCGQTSACKCAKTSVSQKVKNSKSKLSIEEKDAILTKRVATNIEKYGVSNVGQTLTAKEKHQNFYSDNSNILKQRAKQQSTLKAKYGVDNAAHIEGAQEKKKRTTLARYGVENISQLPSNKNKTGIRTSIAWKERRESHFYFNKLNEKFKKVCHVEFNITPEQYNGSVGNLWYEFKCINCNSIFNTWISCGHLPICKTCHPVKLLYKSGEENEIFNYIKSLNVNVTQRNRSIIYPLELDIVDQEQKIAIEYCGLYWHSEISNNKPKDYHINKMLLCENAGYRLITIFSDEWTQKKEIVKRKLDSILKKSQCNKIGARKCNVREISSTDATTFYDKNHLQGAASATIHLGLFFKEELVAAMSFGKNRAFISSNKKTDQHELIRYATNKQIPGGAGKLLNYYIKHFNPSSIMSYADARWSNGQMYKALGFTQENIGNLKPGYWYTQDYVTRQHRFNYTKSSLVKHGNDPSMTEWEIMQSLGFDRIWDCGQLRFKKDIT